MRAIALDFTLTLILDLDLTPSSLTSSPSPSRSRPHPQVRAAFDLFADAGSATVACNDLDLVMTTLGVHVSRRPRTLMSLT